jgi:hypothetical protein
VDHTIVQPLEGVVPLQVLVPTDLIPVSRKIVEGAHLVVEEGLGGVEVAMPATMVV